MPDVPPGRHPADHNAGKDFRLEAEALPPTGLHQHAVQDALRLLAVWAVRAARGHTASQNQDLTVRPPEAMNAPRT